MTDWSNMRPALAEVARGRSLKGGIPAINMVDVTKITPERIEAMHPDRVRELTGRASELTPESQRAPSERLDSMAPSTLRTDHSGLAAGLTPRQFGN